MAIFWDVVPILWKILTDVTEELFDSIIRAIRPW
jgi:hypothetical protein